LNAVKLKTCGSASLVIRSSDNRVGVFSAESSDFHTYRHKVHCAGKQGLSLHPTTSANWLKVFQLPPPTGSTRLALNVRCHISRIVQFIV